MMDANTEDITTILDTDEGYECVDGRLVSWTPFNGGRKLTLHSKMKCPLCQMILGVGYVGKRILLIHQGGKRCKQAQRKLEAERSQGVCRPTLGRDMHPNEEWNSIRQYYVSLGLARKFWGPKSKGAPAVSAVPSSLGLENLVPNSLVAETWPFPVLADYAPLVPQLQQPLPPPLLCIPHAQPVAPVILHFTLDYLERKPNLGHSRIPERGPSPERSPSLECSPSLDYSPISERRPSSGRRPSPIMVEDSSDSESECARTPGPVLEYRTIPKLVRPASFSPPPRPPSRRGLGLGHERGSSLAAFKYPPGSEYQHTRAPSFLVDSRRFVLQAGLVGGETRCWDETPEGQQFLMALKDAREKSGR